MVAALLLCVSAVFWAIAPVAIGLALTLIHLVSIPVTNTSVNPARSTGPALFVGGWPIQQLWLFWLAPLVGAAIAGGLTGSLVGKTRPKRLLTATVKLQKALDRENF